MFTKKIVFTSALLSAAIIAAPYSAQAAQTSSKIEAYFVPMHYIFDGKEYAPPKGQEGMIYENRVYVPLRFMATSLNKAVTWDGTSYTVSMKNPNEQEKTEIDTYILQNEVKNLSVDKIDTSAIKPVNIDVYLEKITYKLDGQTKTPAQGQSGFIYNNRIYVPVRFVSESFGQVIEWNPETYTVNSQSKAYTEKLNQIVNSKEYKTVITETETQITALENECRESLTKIYKQSGISSSELWDKIAYCQNKFDEILKPLDSKLKNLGLEILYITELKQQYKEEYENKAIEEMTKLIG